MDGGISGAVIVQNHEQSSGACVMTKNASDGSSSTTKLFFVAKAEMFSGEREKKTAHWPHSHTVLGRNAMFQWGVISSEKRASSRGVQREGQATCERLQ